MVMVYMLTGYIDGIHGKPYIAAPWPAVDGLANA